MYCDGSKNFDTVSENNETLIKEVTNVNEVIERLKIVRITSAKRSLKITEYGTKGRGSPSNI